MQKESAVLEGTHSPVYLDYIIYWVGQLMFLVSSDAMNPG